MNHQSIQIFPNPTRDYFVLRTYALMSDIIHLSIFTSLCSQVRSYEIRNKPGSKECRIDIRDLKPGLYFIRIESGLRKITKKLIIL